MGKFNILVGDIVSDEILVGHDAIINPTNPRMVCGSGVSGAIFHKAGVDDLERYTALKYGISYFHEENLMEVGMVRVTPGFQLGMDILFVQGPEAYAYSSLEEAIHALLKTYEAMLEVVISRGYKRVLCPSLGTGNYGFTHKDTAKKVVSLLENFVKTHAVDIDFVLYNQEDKMYYMDNLL